MDIKKVHKELIDSQGRRKYFKLLNPKLVVNPPKINIDTIKEKKKYYLFNLTFTGLMKMLTHYGI